MVTFSLFFANFTGHWRCHLPSYEEEQQLGTLAGIKSEKTDAAERWADLLAQATRCGLIHPQNIFHLGHFGEEALIVHAQHLAVELKLAPTDYRALMESVYRSLAMVTAMFAQQVYGDIAAEEGMTVPDALTDLGTPSLVEGAIGMWYAWSDVLNESLLLDLANARVAEGTATALDHQVLALFSKAEAAEKSN